MPAGIVFSQFAIDEQTRRSASTLTTPDRNIKAELAGVTEVDIGGLSTTQGSIQLSKKFVDPKQGSNASGNSLQLSLSVSGVCPEDIKIPDPYLVIIQGERTEGAVKEVWKIYSSLQEDFAFHVKSDWEGFDPFKLGKAGEQLARLAGGTLKSTFSSRRYWSGTSALDLTLKLQFQAYDDPYKCVVEPTLRLLQLAAPAVNEDFFHMLVPPGPNPFKTESVFGIQLPAKVVEHLNRGDNISISIGRQWLFESVIVSDVRVSYPTKYTRVGHPVTANVDLSFQTYEVITKEALDKAFVIKS